MASVFSDIYIIWNGEYWECNDEHEGEEKDEHEEDEDDEDDE